MNATVSGPISLLDPGLESFYDELARAEYSSTTTHYSHLDILVLFPYSG